MGVRKFLTRSRCRRKKTTKIWMHPVRGQLVCIMVMNFVLESNIMVMMWDNKKLRRKVKERERSREEK